MDSKSDDRNKFRRNRVPPRRTREIYTVSHLTRSLISQNVTHSSSQNSDLLGTGWIFIPANAVGHGRICDLGIMNATRESRVAMELSFSDCRTLHQGVASGSVGSSMVWNLNSRESKPALKRRDKLVAINLEKIDGYFSAAFPAAVPNVCICLKNQKSEVSYGGRIW